MRRNQNYEFPSTASIPPRSGAVFRPTMGGAVSAGQNNAELVDNLCMENYISTPEVEKVYVCVCLCNGVC